MKETEIRATLKRQATQIEQNLSMHRALARTVIELRADLESLRKKVGGLATQDLPASDKVPTNATVPEPVSPEVPK